MAALASLLNRELFAAPDLSTRGALPVLHFAPKAKHVIYLHQSGAPSHVDLFDYKPEMQKHHGKELPASVPQAQRARVSSSCNSPTQPRSEKTLAAPAASPKPNAPYL